MPQAFHMKSDTLSLPGRRVRTQFPDKPSSSFACARKPQLRGGPCGAFTYNFRLISGVNVGKCWQMLGSNYMPCMEEIWQALWSIWGLRNARGLCKLLRGQPSTRPTADSVLFTCPKGEPVNRMCVSVALLPVNQHMGLVSP